MAIISWTSIRPYIFQSKTMITLETVATQRFQANRQAAQKKRALKNAACGDASAGPSRRLRQMNGTRLKLFSAGPPSRAKKFVSPARADFDRGDRHLDARRRRPEQRRHFPVRWQRRRCANAASTTTRSRRKNRAWSVPKLFHADRPATRRMRVMHARRDDSMPAARRGRVRHHRVGRRLGRAPGSLRRKRRRPHWAAGNITLWRKTQWSSFSTSSS